MTLRLIALINDKRKLLAKGSEADIAAALATHKGRLRQTKWAVQQWNEAEQKWQKTTPPQPAPPQPAPSQAESTAPPEVGDSETSTESDAGAEDPPSAPEPSASEAPSGPPARDSPPTADAPVGADTEASSPEASEERVRQALVEAAAALETAAEDPAQGVLPEQLPDDTAEATDATDPDGPIAPIDPTSAPGHPAKRRLRLDQAGLRKRVRGVTEGLGGVELGKLGDQARDAAANVKSFTRAGLDDLQALGMEQVGTLVERANVCMPILEEAGFKVKNVNVRVGVIPDVKVELEMSPNLSEASIVDKIDAHKDDTVVLGLLRTLLLAYRFQNAANIGDRYVARIVMTLIPPNADIEFKPKESEEPDDDTAGSGHGSATSSPPRLTTRRDLGGAGGGGR